MLGSPKSPAPGPVAGNVTPNKVSTNQQAVPITYFAGRRWLTLIQNQTSIYNPKPRPVVQKVGKSTSQTGFDYFGSLVGVTSCVCNDYLEAIEVNGEVVWGGAIHRDEDHQHHSGDIVVPGVATFRYYWGTSNQPADDLVLAACGEPHSRHLEQSYLVAKDLYFGNNNSTPPTIRVLVERAARFEGLDEERGREGTNPVTALAEFLTNDWFGLGMPASVIHLESWAATAEAIKRPKAVPLEGAEDYVARMGYISPFLERTQSARAFIAQILEHFDGWIRPQDGQLRIGHFPHDGAIPDDLPELSYHDFVEGKRPKFEPSGESEIITDVTVVHLDRDQELEETATPVPNPSARRRVGETRTKTFRRPFIVTTYQGREMGDQLARHYSREEEACIVTARREKVVGLHAGDRFVLIDAASESSQIVRITEREDDGDGGEVELSLVLERGLAPVAYIPPPQPTPTLPPPELVDVEHARIFQLPTLFADYGPEPVVVALAERPGQHVAGFRVHYSDNNVSYDLLAEIGVFALRATLAAPIDANDDEAIFNASGFDIALLTAQSDAAKSDDTLLAIVGYEILSIGDLTALGGGQYQVELARGRRGSGATAHAATDVVFIIRREDLVHLRHANFPRAIANKHFKLESYTLREPPGGLPDALHLEFTFDDTTCPAPSAFAATARAEAIYLSWGYPAPPDDQTILQTDIWEKATNVAPDPDVDAPTYSMRANGFNRGGLAAATTRYYWARNRDRVGVSALVGSVTATALAAATGAPGATGNSRERRYMRSALVPATPFGNNPAGWTLDIPNGTEAVWGSDATKDGSGNVVGSWSAPQRLSGSVIFYTTGAPGGHTLIDGDTYFDLSDNNKIYRRTGGAWVAAFQPMFKLDGNNNISGLVKADGTNKDFCLIADKFQIWNGVSADVPFELVGTTTYIKDAFIQNVAAGKIQAGTINVALSLGVGASITAGSGFGQFSVNSSEMKHGILTVKQFPGVSGTQLDIISGTHKVEAFAYNGSAAGLNVTSGAKLVQIGSDGTLRTDGPFEVKSAGSATFVCAITAQNHVYLANGCNLNCGGDIHLGLSGVNRWLYDGNNNRILQQRYGVSSPADASDLASVITLANWLKDVALHHGFAA